MTRISIRSPAMAASKYGYPCATKAFADAGLRERGCPARPAAAGCLASDIDFAITMRNDIVARAGLTLWIRRRRKAGGIPMPNVRVLATDLEFPEGPVVMPDGSVVLVEIRGRRLTRVWPEGRKKEIAEIP